VDSEFRPPAGQTDHDRKTGVGVGSLPHLKLLDERLSES